MKKKILSIVLIILINLIFVDFVGAETYNNYTSEMVSCGNGLVEDIPQTLPKVISIAYTIIQIAVPIVLVVVGSLDLFKGITAQKEDEMKKGQGLFVKRLISAALIFFVFVIVKVVISFAADKSSIEIMQCAECFINNKCDIATVTKIN